MAIFHLRGVGNKGVISDIPPFDLSPDTWSNANNVRFQANRVQKIGGNNPTIMEGMPNVKPLAVVQRPMKSEMIYGTGDPFTNKGKLYRTEGGVHEDISRWVDPDDHDKGTVDYNSSPTTPWSYSILSNTIVMSTKFEDPQGITPFTDRFDTIPGWGKPKKDSDVTVNWKTNRIRAYKNYLICLGMIENGVEYAQRVRWSDIAFVDELPQNWWEDSEDHDGGFNDLSDSLSYIIDGAPLRDSFVIYTNRDTFLMDYVGGALVFNFRKIFSDSGILTDGCCVEFEGKHFVISEDDIFVHNGSTRKSIVTGRVKDKLIQEISSVNPNATKVYSYPTRKEIWVTYVRPGSTNPDGLDNYACNRAAVWSWEYDTWSFYDIPDIYDIGLGIPPDVDNRRWDTMCGTEGEPVPEGCDDTWDGKSHSEETWEPYSKTFNKLYMYAASDDNCFYTLDTGFFFYRWDHKKYWEDFKSDETIKKTDPKYLSKYPVVCEVERLSLDFDEQEQDISFYKWWRSIYPQMTGEGTARFFVGGSDNPYKAPIWTEVQDFVIGEDWKVDCFNNFRYPAIKIQNFSEGEWDFTGFDIEYFKEGNR
ncbi:virion-associated protein [Proteus phage Privateer]|uniref:Virion-associated protein n=1 Tax=Proteus phage Privateer TaxID=2712958 RepID=A0A6G8R3R5_9CAUD|nr:tail fiber protein; host specificity [Proteus phage Privateer]QIN94806.1 virion-associated protein [Proteus phage Privateer]